LPTVTGPELNKLREELIEWYSLTRQKLIEALEEDTPYGSRKLTPDEQLERYLNMTDQDWQALQVRLEERFRGLPDANDRVKQDLQNFNNRMQQMLRRRQMKADRLTQFS
jgi:hypothetical protein